MSDDLEYVRRAVALRDSVEAAFRNYLDGSGFDAKQLAVEVTKLLDDRKALQAEVDRLTKLLPRCLGEWVSGSGGHRKYTGGCSNPGVWDVGLGFVCDAHKNKNGGDDDAWRWEEEEERLRSENDRLSKALVDACTTVEQCPPITDWPGQPLQYDRSVPKPGQGHAWIQWKGTDVCMDVRCRCGAHGHVDASFAYFYKCLACGDTFAVGQTVRLYALDEEYAKRHQGVQPVVADDIVDAEGKPLDELKVTYTVITEDES